ncbi:efflux RND transporter periplasmic adaptor subunit [Roseobacter sinensis]|uniref:Efflux RND transporter periplasmic adaptor subunit n=1 Tax=Roseobacter sinensis TaxID=2931391 RepID=A0ABT3BHR1_9RHOB|nr:efflux RND transporter periplasmic adaptor subunit [Roseobacter sp. WL0113]MCV3273080.1 efflux RND transporter periplasmic adaptor subunit [Roseobacter sp. WL0113]
MTFARQLLLTLGLVSCSSLVAAHYSPNFNTTLGGLGLPTRLLDAIAKEDSEAQSAQRERPPRGQGRGQAAIVTTAVVTTAALSDTAQAIGTSEALRSVSVVPFGGGVLTDVLVASGDMVAAGDLLARLESDAEQVARDRAAVALRLAETEYTRYESLARSNVASQTELESLRAARDDAELALREAEVALQRRSIFSPIGGVVGIVPVEVGDYVTTETEIAMVDDRSQVLVDFWLPERFVGMLALSQQVTATSLALERAQFTGEVNAIGSRVQTDSRTIQVRALIDNRNDLIRPGMSFSIEMTFDGDSYPAVDPLAVNWDGDGAYVWVVADGVATRTAARIVQRNADTVLIVSDLEAGAQVVTEGGLNVRDGAAVTLHGNVSPNGIAVRRDADGPSSSPSAPSRIGEDADGRG